MAKNPYPLKIIPEAIIFAGGIDVMTPPFQLKPGLCRQSQNFECSIYGGYRRIAGYERFDGQASPSDAKYTVLACSSITGGAVGNTLTGATSGATGVIIAIETSNFILTKTTGTFQAENLNVGGPTIGISTGAGTIGGASTPKLNAQYLNLAADVYRNLIAAVPGSGKVLGVQYYNDVLYAFRNNAGGTAAAMYKSTAAGWSLIALGRELKFTSGNASIAEGSTITGATSGASAVLTRQALESGTYAGGTAAGTFVFASVTAGPFQNGENLQVGGVTKAVANGADAAITLLPGGRFEFVNANFTGSTNTKRMYGCDGVNRAFEFDGTVFVPINTGMTTDTPTHIEFHLYHLFLSFNASVQYSSTGFPYQWTPITGAAELAMGDQISGFKVQPSGTTNAAALAVFTQGRLSILYGTGSSNFQLVPYKDEIGAYAFTMQNLAQTIFLDQQGVTDITTTIAFGNFVYATLTNQFKSTLATWKTLAVASGTSRDLAQYRIFFTNKYALYISMIGEQVIGVMPMLFTDVVRCACSSRKLDGTEVNFFGSDNGMVFQLDKGTSFDGADIEAFMNLAYNFSKSPRTIKRYRNGALEITGSEYCEFNFGYSLGYGATDLLQPSSVLNTTNFSATNWDAFTWDAAFWDGITLTPTTIDMDGEAENVSLAITSTSDSFQPFTFTSALIHYSPRREIR